MLADLLRPRREDRSQFPTISQTDYLRQLEAMAYGGNRYMIAGGLDHRAVEFATCNAAVAAVIGFRVSVFAEATFKFQNWQNGRPGALFGNPTLDILENPWPGAGTSHLLAAMEVDISVFGNSYWIVSDNQLVRLDPKCVTIATSDVQDNEYGVSVGKRLVGYMYQEPRKDPAFFLPDEVAHYRLVPDPECPFRGTSWLRAVMSDVDADSKMTGYKQALLENSAVPGLVLKAEPGVSEEQFIAARDVLKARNTGWDKVGRTLMLGAGFDVKVVGASMQQLDMKALQGAGESRIASAGGVGAVLVSFSEGQQGSALNAGNYGAARRRFADGTVRPLWRAACTALSTLVPPPQGSRLWIDDRDVSFLQEDVKDAADIKSTEANTMESLIRAGFTPDSARDAVITGDYSVLVHTGLYSVQLQPPGADQPAPSRADVVAAEDRALAPAASQPSEMHIHLPETAQVEIRQDEMFGALERIAQRQVTTDGLANAVTAGVAAAIRAMPASVHNHQVDVHHQPIPVQMEFEIPAPIVNVAPTPVVKPGKRTVKFVRDGEGNVTGATMLED